VTVAGDGQGVRESIALLHEDLVSNTSSGWVEVDTMVSSKLFDVCVLLEVLGSAILNVVVKSKDRLSGFVNFGGAY
jgi:hypothetical protein